MKDLSEANFPIYFTISYDSKIGKQICKKKIYSNIHEKYSPLIFVYAFWLPNNCMRYARMFLHKLMLLLICWSHLTARRVNKSDMLTAFNEQCLLQFIQNKKIIGRCNLLVKLQDTCKLNKRNMSTGVLQYSIIPISKYT